MDYNSLQREFSVRYYRWALQDFTREIAQDFPFLRRLTCGSCSKAAAMLGAKDRPRQITLASALVKRFHKEGMEAAGDHLTPDEVAAAKEYLDYANQPDLSELPNLQESAPPTTRTSIRRRELIRLVRSAMVTELMEVFEPENPAGVIKYRTIIADWQIITRVHTRERYARLAYDQALWSIKSVREMTLVDGRRELWPVQLHSWISFAGWLGISSCTEWYYITVTDGPRVAELLATLCRHFLRAAPELLDGLSV